MPSKTELAAIICRSYTSGVTGTNEDSNCATFGYGSGSNNIPGIQTAAYGAYVSSSGFTWAGAPIFEQVANGSGTGNQGSLTNTTAGYVRCIRRIQ